MARQDDPYGFSDDNLSSDQYDVPDDQREGLKRSLSDNDTDDDEEEDDDEA